MENMLAITEARQSAKPMKRTRHPNITRLNTIPIAPTIPYFANLEFKSRLVVAVRKLVISMDTVSPGICDSYDRAETMKATSPSEVAL